MDISSRSEEEALGQGADVWVVGELERSSWTRKIDWYLNFQILRSTARRPSEITSELEDVLNRWEFVAPQRFSSPNLMMIASQSLLPNRSVVVVPVGNGDAKSWAKQIHSVWKDLGSPQLRIFLPKGIDASRFSSAWPEDKETLRRTLVSEPL